MTPLLALSIACTAFVGGFSLGLMGCALFAGIRREAADHDAGAAEGDQINFSQRSSSSPGAG